MAWAWIGVGLGVGLGAVVAVTGAARAWTGRAALLTWRQRADEFCREAALVADLLSPPVGMTVAAHAGSSSIAHRVEQLAASARALLDGAPGRTERRATAACVDAIERLLVALAAERSLHVVPAGVDEAQREYAAAVVVEKAGAIRPPLTRLIAVAHAPDAPDVGRVA